MTATSTDLKSTIRFLIHLGLVEIRHLGMSGGNHAYIAKLADVLEFLPRELADDREPDFDMVREQFEQYQQLNPQPAFDYLSYLDGKNPIHDY